MGSPAQWKCGKCNRTSYQQGEEGEGGIWIANTGRPGPTRERRGMPDQLQYKCEVCGHVGWTCLGQAWREFHKMFPDKPVARWWKV